MGKFKGWTQGRGPGGHPGSRTKYAGVDVPVGVYRFKNPPRYQGGRCCDKRLASGEQCYNMARWEDTNVHPRAYLCDKHVPTTGRK